MLEELEMRSEEKAAGAMGEWTQNQMVRQGKEGRLDRAKISERMKVIVRYGGDKTVYPCRGNGMRRETKYFKE